MMIRRSNIKRFGALQKQMMNASHVGRNEYPQTSQDAYHLLRRYKESNPRSNRPGNPNGRPGVSFAQRHRRNQNEDDDNNEDVPVPGTNGRTTHHRCF